MKKKTVSRLSAMFMAGAMMAATFGMSVCAEGEVTEAPKQATITKEITKPGNVYAPNTEFTFTIKPGTAVEATESSDAIYAGPADGAAFANGSKTVTISSVPASGDIGQESITAGTATIKLGTFPAPGIYRYEVTETAGSYEGITYSTETKYFDVYVNSDLEVVSYAFVSAEDSKTKDDGVFTNDYGKTNGKVHNLTVKKTVAGNQGDKNKDFSFTIKIAGANGEQYYMVVGNTTYTVKANEEESQTFTLKDNQTAIIYGLSDSDEYTVTETDYSAEGYKTTIDTVEENTKTARIAADTTVNVVNTKNANTPTGIIASYAPYILMVAAAGAAVVFFLRRRNRAEF